MLVYGGMEFPEKLRDLLDSRRMAQADLGAAVGLQQSRISKWVNGKGEPSLSQGLLLARALKVPIEYLADDKADKPSPELSEAERLILETVRALGLEKGATIRALHEAARWKDHPVPRHGDKPPMKENTPPKRGSRPKKRGRSG